MADYHIRKEEVKPVLGYQSSEQYYQPQYNPGYSQPCVGYPTPNAQPHLNYYDYQTNYQTNYHNYPPGAGPLPYVSPDANRGFSFARVMLCLMLFLILFATIMSLITWSVFSSLMPTFTVESFNVRSFEISPDGSSLKANWETKVSVKNSNRRSSIMIDHAESKLVYRYATVDESTVDHLEIKKESTEVIMDAFAIPNTKRSYTGGSMVSEMIKDQASGHISFDLKIEVDATFKSGSVMSKRKKLQIFCEKLNLDFQNGSPVPTWKESKQECIYG